MHTPSFHAFWRFSGRSAPLPSLMVVAVSVLTSAVAPAGQAVPTRDVELQVGIVQRFGSQTTKPLTLQAQSGDRLTVRFLTDGKPQTLSASTARLEIVMQPLTEPQLEERLVLSTHRSFETAEDTAQRWQAQGIPVEVGQPGRWQVWAQRSVYNDPLLRRLLLKNLQSQGIQTAFLDTQMVKQRPKAALVLNGYRYLRDQIDISSGRGVIQVGPVAGESWRLYAGSLRLQRNAYGTYTLVNQVPLEAYLRGVVPYEIGTWAPQSVLEAQAILARTYALRNLRRFAIDNYQLCADTQCQVYNGLNGAHPATDRAIAATRGKVLTYQNELVDAVYSSTTGGVTASFTDVWQGQPRPYLQSIIDSTTSPWDLGRKSLADEANFQTFIRKTKGFNEEGQRLFRWQEVARLPQLKQELQDYLKSRKHPLAGFGSIQQMVVTERSPAGRVQKLQIITDQGPIELKKDDIRVAFSAPYSTLFYLEPLYDQKRKLNGYAFVGGGFGHGVGLSQTGSYRLGELGWSSDRILRFYFPGTAIQPLNSSIVFWQAPPVPVANPLQLSSK